MPRASRSAAEWDVLIDDFLAAGLPQREFCEQREIPLHAFCNRYQKSPKFAGKRRDATKRKRGGFVSVRPAGAPRTSTAPRGVATATIIRIGSDVVVECPQAIAIDTIARLASEARR